MDGGEENPAALLKLGAVLVLQVSEVLDQWITLQRTWMHLEPIFSSDDIMQQLPLEGKRFATVDRSWRKTMDAAKRTPSVLKVLLSHTLIIFGKPHATPQELNSFCRPLTGCSRAMSGLCSFHKCVIPAADLWQPEVAGPTG
jgi:hypothetical protein